MSDTEETAIRFITDSPASGSSAKQRSPVFGTKPSPRPRDDAVVRAMFRAADFLSADGFELMVRGHG